MCRVSWGPALVALSWAVACSLLYVHVLCVVGGGYDRQTVVVVMLAEEESASNTDASV